MNSNPQFSVIIPAYNRKDFLKSAVDSVLKQSYGDFELIIVDDGSDDGTDQLICGYEDLRINYVFQKHSGVSKARNRGLSEAQGNYIAFLDSDDRWLSKKLEVIANAIAENPEYYIYHTQEKWYRNGRHLNHMKKHSKKSGHIFDSCLKMCSISISTAVVKREIFDEIGVFDENLTVCEDYDFWIRASWQYPVLLIDRVLTLKEGGHEDQLSSMYWGMDRFRIKSICKLLDNENLSKEHYNTAYKELRNKCGIYANGCFKRGKENEGNRYLEIISEYNRDFIAYE
jgi:glycosyltransferase involved in cell wall biosynthesis